MTKLKPIPIAKPATGDEEWQATKGPIMRGWLTQGSEVAAFEGAFAKRHQVNHAIATTSGTSALHLSLLALDIGPGDEVIVPAFTWVSTANAVRFCGADVRLAARCVAEAGGSRGLTASRSSCAGCPSTWVPTPSR